MVGTGMASPRKLYTVQELAALEDPGNHWLVPQMVPRIGRTMAWGDGGTFKTTAMLDLAIAVASGGLFLQHYPVDITGPVIVISTEGDIYSARRRVLEHIRARDQSHTPEAAQRMRPPLPTLTDIPLHFGHRPYDFATASDLREFKQELERIKPVMVLLDPLDSFIEGDENSAHQTKPFRRELDSLIDEYEFSLVIIHHAGKEQEGKKASARGSSAWRGWVDAYIYFRKMELDIDGSTYPYFDIYSEKQRDGASNQRVCAAIPIFDSQRRMISFAPIETAGLDSHAIGEAERRILDALWRYDPQPLTQSDLMKETHLSQGRLKRALSSLRKDGWAIHDAAVMRSTSTDGTRTRQVLAWRPLRKTTLTDQAVAILKAQELAEELENGPYIEFTEPENADDSSVVTFQTTSTASYSGHG